MDIRHVGAAISVFGTYHPVTVFAYFLCAMLVTMFIHNPILLALGLALSAAFYFSVRGKSAWKVVLAALLVMCALGFVNGLFNAQGDTVLFTYFDMRNYTLEGLLYGLCTGAMFACVILLFGSFNRLLTSEKLLFLFGGFMPAVTLTLTMAFRFVPNYQIQARDMHEARLCIGMGAQSNFLVRSFSTAGSVLAGLATWALEGSVITADSMKSRGYGLVKRSTYSHYEFSPRDIIALVLIVLSTALTVTALLSGNLEVVFFPVPQIPQFSVMGAIGLVSYSVLLALPLVINLKGLLTWRIYLSRN